MVRPCIVPFATLAVAVLLAVAMLFAIGSESSQAARPSYVFTFSPQPAIKAGAILKGGFSVPSSKWVQQGSRANFTRKGKKKSCAVSGVFNSFIDSVSLNRNQARLTLGRFGIKAPKIFWSKSKDRQIPFLGGAIDADATLIAKNWQGRGPDGLRVSVTGVTLPLTAMASGQPAYPVFVTAAAPTGSRSCLRSSRGNAKSFVSNVSTSYKLRLIQPVG